MADIMKRLLAPLAITLLACGGEGPSATAIPEVPVRIGLEPPAVSFDALSDTQTVRALLFTNLGRVLPAENVTWSTSDPKVAVVDERGLVRARENGSVEIVARIDTLSSSGGVTVLQKVASLEVRPRRTAVARGRTIRLEAVPLDPLGNPVEEAVVDWSSTNAAAVRVLPPGLVIAVSPDTSEVLASSEGVTGISEIQVVDDGWPNEPLGFSVWNDQSFDALGSNGWSHQNRTAYSRIVEDPTAPFSGGNVLEQFYPEGFTNYGSSPAIDWIDARGEQDLYVGFWFKASDPWHGHASGINKVLFIWDQGHDDFVVLSMRGPVGGPYHMEVVVSAGEDIYRSQNVNQLPVTLGAWHRIELRVSIEDGLLEWWQDGVKLGSYSGLPLSPGFDGFGQIEIAPTWGGVGGPDKQQDDYFRYDHFYISTPAGK